MVQKFSFFVFLFFFHFVYGQNEGVKEISLTIGEVKSLEKLGESKINFSRRGIVVANFTPDKKWQIVGHRKGFVVLSYYDSVDALTKNIFITVKSKDTVQNKISKKPWFCSQKQIKCSENPLHISGETSSWQLFYQIKKWSDEKNQVYNYLQLNNLGQKFLARELSLALKNLASYELGNQGIKALFLACSVKEEAKTFKIKQVHSLLKSLQINSFPPVMCRYLLQPKQYRVSAKVSLATDSTENLSGGSTVSLSDLVGSEKREKLLEKIESLEKKNSLEIIGEPQIIVREGAQSFSKTGGEFSYIKESYHLGSSHKAQDWKPYGLNLKTIVMSVRKKVVQVSYELGLSVPSSGATLSSVKTIHFSGEVIINLGEKNIVAMTKYDSKARKLEKDSFWSKVPLLSLFFSRENQEKLSSYLVFSLEVKAV